MKNFLILSVLLLLLSACYKGKKVDLIIHNAVVYKMNDALEKAEAMAIMDGEILEIGPERAILNKYTADQIIDAQSKDIYPGFHDSHGHIMSFAKQRLNVDLRKTSSLYEVIARLEKFQSKKNKKILIGRGWDQSLWGEKSLPNNQLLNEKFPSTPVALTRIDGHAMLINKAMMEYIGITDSTTIEGGVIERKEGELTGILLDHALELVNDQLPAPEEKDLKAEILEIQNELLAYGITEVDEAGLTRDELQLFIDLATKKKLKINVYAMLFPTEKNIEFAEKNGFYTNHHLSVRSFKVIVDGSLGSHGACMLSPYSDEPNKTGFLLKKPNEIKRIFRKGKALNYQVNSHCIGDSANRFVLQIIDTLMDDLPDHRWRIEHAQVIHPDDFELFTSSGVIPSVQPTHAVSDQRWAEQHIGKKRLKNGAYAYHTLHKKTGMILFGTDFPIEDINPFATIHAAVQRKNTDNEPRGGFLPDEAVSFSTTLKAMTFWPAFGSFQESHLGSLEVGKDATFAIFDQPVKSQKKYLPNYAWLTVVNGEIQFDMRE
jgi:predicted amidohydrolase YtcJ